MSADDLQAWGWRIPFALGLLIGPVGYYIRNRLPETPEFLSAGEPHAPLRDLFVDQWGRLLLTIGAVAASVREKLTALGVDPMIMSPAEFDTYVRKDIVASAALVKSAGIKPE